MDIAEKLGYVSIVDILKPITEVRTTVRNSEDKYKVVSPETMQETFISDSEDDGGRFLSGCAVIFLCRCSVCFFSHLNACHFTSVVFSMNILSFQTYN